jgi:hypothetical protein
MVAAKPKATEIDMSLDSWIYNTRSVLQFPLTILTIIALLIGGTFTETAPRKSLEFLDSTVGKIVFFIIPLVLGYLFSWSTGLLAAVVSLILFTRLQKIDLDEGFMDSVDSDTSDVTTKIILSPHRWFVEKILGENPMSISSDRIRTTMIQDENQRTRSSTSLSSKSSISLIDQLETLNSSSSNK